MSTLQSLLTNEQALASRIVVSGVVPRSFWAWLHGNAQQLTDELENLHDESVALSLSEIIQPNLSEVSTSVREGCRNADIWFSRICAYVAIESDQLGLSTGRRMLAMSLLPLYRSLATGRLQQAIQQSASRMGEALALIGLAQELGQEFVDLLEKELQHEVSPHRVLFKNLKINLSLQSQLCSATVDHFHDNEFSEQYSAEILGSENLVPPPVPTWAQPDLLWNIAGELMAKRAEIVLPREWVDTPIPWTSISDHWNTLSHRLTVMQYGQTKDKSDIDCDWHVIDSLAGPPVKLVLSEIHSTRDPVLVNVLSRQLIASRNEGVMLSLVAIKIEPEHPQNEPRLRSGAAKYLSVWQQRLVNRIVEHPELQQPYGFVTREGHLVLCLLNLERNTTMAAVRESLSEVLDVEGTEGESLNCTPVHSRFYAGIGCVSSPTTGFAVETLIEATWRCLSAAQSQGNSSIKSIEVF